MSSEVLRRVGFYKKVGDINPRHIESAFLDDKGDNFGGESVLISENMRPVVRVVQPEVKRSMDFNPTFVSVDKMGGGSSSTVNDYVERKPATTDLTDGFGYDLDPQDKDGMGNLDSPQKSYRGPNGTQNTDSFGLADEMIPRLSNKGIKSAQDHFEVNGNNIEYLRANSSKGINPLNLLNKNLKSANGRGANSPESDMKGDWEFTRPIAKTHANLLNVEMEEEEEEGGMPDDYIPMRRRCLSGLEFKGVLTEKYQEQKKLHGNDPYFYRKIDLEDQYMKPNAKPPINHISEAVLIKFFQRFAPQGTIDAAQFPKLIEEIYHFEKKPTPSYLQCLYLMSKYDTNKDGMIDFSEFKHMMSEL